MEQYFSYLKKLVALPSVFTSPDDVQSALAYCKSVFEENLSGYSIYFDSHNNLVAVPRTLDLEKDIVYLSAHIDTVDADATRWDHPYQPFVPYEDDAEIVGRGVNDCKAGVAFQLYLSWLVSQRDVSLNNLIFTITFKEEGSGKKTSVALGKALGNELPLSNAQTYLFVLENTVKVQIPPVLCVYSQERSNFVIAVDGTISYLQQLLTQLIDWNPVSIRPLDGDSFSVVSSRQQAGGHVCSRPRSENILVDVIMNADNTTLISAGSEESFAVIPTDIQLGLGDSKHRLVLSNRNFIGRNEIHQQLEDISYVPLKDFDLSEGFNIEQGFMESSLKKVLDELATDKLVLEYTYNIGGSDASIIYSQLDESIRLRILPLVMGPGCRSQKNIEPQRLTHGKNETFDKQSGIVVVKFLLTVLKRLSVLC